MKEFLAVLFLSFGLFAAGGDTLQYSTSVEGLDDGDPFFAQVHWHSMIDTVQSFINGRLGDFNISDSAEINGSKLDSSSNTILTDIRAKGDITADSIRLTSGAYIGGDVGIGRVPTGRLDVYDSTDNAILTVGSNSTGRRGIVSIEGNQSVEGSDFGYYGFSNTLGTGTPIQLLAVRGSSNDNGELNIKINDSTSIYLDEDNNTGIGVAAPEARLHIKKVGVSSDPTVYLDRYTSSLTGPSEIQFRKSYSNTDALSPTVDNEFLGNISFSGVNSSNSFVESAYMQVFQEGGAGTYNGSQIIWGTSDGSSAVAERMRLTSSGDLGLAAGETYNNRLFVDGDIGLGNEDTIANDASINFRTEGAGRFVVDSVGGTDKRFVWSVDGGDTDQVVIDNRGYVGIGTDAPISALHVSHVGNSTGGIVLGDVNTSANNTGMYMRTTGTANINTATGGEISLSVDQGATASIYIDSVSSTGAGNVGIGTDAPFSALHVSHVGSANGFTLGDVATPANNTGIYLRTSGVANINTVTGGAISFSVNQGVNSTIYIDTARAGGIGYVGIGTSSPGYLLTVNGEPGANGYTAFTNYSDSTLKKNITPVESVLDEIMQLNPVEFQYNDKYMEIYGGTDTSKVHKGFIAQEVQNVFPEMVTESGNEEESYLRLNLTNMQVYLVKAIQELKEENDNLKARIEVLEGN